MVLFSRSVVILALALLHCSVNAARSTPRRQTTTPRPIRDIRMKEFDDDYFTDSVIIFRDGLPVCAGTLIGANHVLTARGCIVGPTGYFFGNIIAIAGRPYLNEPYYEHPVNMYPISITVDKKHDIALLKFDHTNDDRLKTNEYSAKLPSYDKLKPDGTEIPSVGILVSETVTNYNHDDYPNRVINQTFPVNLSLLDLRIGDESFCKKQWGKYYNKYTQYCNDVPVKYVGGPFDNHGGGGVFWRNRIYGVVGLMERKYAETRYDAILITNVLAVKDWIEDVMKDVGNQDSIHYKDLETCKYDGKTGNRVNECREVVLLD